MLLVYVFFVRFCRNQIEKNSSLMQQERLDYLEEGKKVR